MENLLLWAWLPREEKLLRGAAARRGAWLSAQHPVLTTTSAGPRHWEALLWGHPPVEVTVLPAGSNGWEGERDGSGNLSY